MREVRLALLEADVNFKVVKEFVARVKEKAIGVEVLESLSPAQQVIKIVNDEMVELLGGTQTGINLSPTPPTVIMLCGLQGAGKTTLSGKLAAWYKKQGRNPLMVACDIYRPAAVKQLQVLGEQIKIPVFTLPPGEGKSPPTIARAAIQQAKQNGNDIVILDTAGRLAIDEELMDELGQMKAWVKPHEILLVVDAMVGQDAVNFAQRVQLKAGPHRLRDDEDGRRHARRRGALDPRSDRRADQVSGHRRKARRAGAFLSRPPRLPHSRHGRHPEPDREGRRRPSMRRRRRSSKRSCAKASSTSTTSSNRCSR